MLQTVEDDASRWGFRMAAHTTANAAGDLLGFAAERRFRTILADPPWQFTNKTGKVAPEHRRLTRYSTMSLEQIKSLPVEAVAVEPAHLYLWVPNALLPDGLSVMAAWGFQYKSNVVWHKVRKDGGSDGRGVGFYFRNVTELLLFGVRGKNARTLPPGRRQVNMIETWKREHSRKPDEQYEVIESAPLARSWNCSRVGRAAVGQCGEIRRTTHTSQPGTHMHFIPGR